MVIVTGCCQAWIRPTTDSGVTLAPGWPGSSETPPDHRWIGGVPVKYLQFSGLALTST